MNLAEWSFAVVIFGDPDNGQAVGKITSSKVKIFCAVGDDICLGGDLILPAHLSYGIDAPAAALFVASTVGLWAFMELMFVLDWVSKFAEGWVCGCFDFEMRLASIAVSLHLFTFIPTSMVVQAYFRTLILVVNTWLIVQCKCLQAVVRPVRNCKLIREALWPLFKSTIAFPFLASISQLGCLLPLTVLWSHSLWIIRMSSRRRSLYLRSLTPFSLVLRVFWRA